MTTKKQRELIDRLGDLKKEMDRLEKFYEEVRQQLVCLGPGEFSGKEFFIQVSQFDKTTVDWNAVKQDYDLPLDRYSTTKLSTRITVKEL